MRWEDETRMAAGHLGYEIVETDGINDYQGWGVHLLRMGSQWAVLSWGYGTCSGCDAFEGQFVEYDDRLRADACAVVFGELIETCADEDAARRLFDERKGW